MSDRRHDAPFIDNQSVTASNTHGVEFPFHCKSCSEFKDSSKWELFEPSEISDDAHEMMYRITLESGCYECRRTGLRVECSGDVQLEYQTCDWDRVHHEPVMKDYSPCGSLMDVKVISGELKAVYLPHFLCLGGSIDEDKVKVLHVEDNGVSLEKCELTRFHAKLLDNTFSVKGLLVWMGFPVNIHCQTLIYQTGKTHLTLHVYLIPNDKTLKEAINKEESTIMLIKKPKPVNPLPMNTWFTFTPLKKSEFRSQITPERLQLTYSDNYFEVYVESPKKDFSLQLKPQKKDEVVWDVSIRKGDYKQITSTVDGHTSARLTGTGSVSDILLECLEDLKSKELEKFTWYLTKDSFEGKDKIPRSKLEDKEIWDIVTCMIEHYQDNGAVKVTLKVLEEMNQNHLAEQLQEKYRQFQQ
nr:NACHT, LRR and PYD domains-containing protein 1 homolog [Misgurnus anguillicaudatus]